MAHNSFQYLDFDGLLIDHSLSLDAAIMVLAYRLPWQQYDLLKALLITALGAYNSKMASWWIFFYIINIKHDKVRLLVKYKKIL